MKHPTGPTLEPTKMKPFMIVPSIMEKVLNIDEPLSCRELDSLQRRSEKHHTKETTSTTYEDEAFHGYDIHHRKSPCHE